MTLTEGTRPPAASSAGWRTALRRRVRDLRDDSLYRNSALLLLGTVELAVGGFLFWQIVAHLFSTDEVGRASALVSASTLIANLALFGMNNSLIRYLNEWPDRAATANTALAVVTGAAAVGAAGFALGSRWFAPDLDLSRGLLDAALFVVFTATLAASLVNDSLFVALRRSGYILSRNTVMVLLRLALPAAFLAFGAFGIFTAYQVAIALALPVYLVMLQRRFALPTRLRARRDRLVAMWRYSAGNYVATAILMLPTLVMPVLVAQRVSASDAAYFYMASLLASALLFIPQATTRSFFAEAMHDLPGLRGTLRRVIRLTASAQLPVFLLLLLTGEFALSLFGPPYAGAYPVLVLLAVSNALASVGFVGSTLLMLTGRLRTMCTLSAVACTVSLTGSFLLADRGLVWIGWSLVVAELFLSVAYIVLVARMLRPAAPARRRLRGSPDAFVTRAAAAVADRWRQRLISRAVDRTAQITRLSVLVLAPHPDDETFGVGATIARCTAAGTPVTVAVATDGRGSTGSRAVTPEQLARIRAAEMVEACRVLGVGGDDLVTLGFRDGSLAENFEELVRRLGVILRERRPEQVFVPCVQDAHPDHSTLHRALLRAVRDSGLDCQIAAYLIGPWMFGPWYVGLPFAKQARLIAFAFRQAYGRRRPVAVSTTGHLAAKEAALRAHASQTTNLTGEPDWQYLQERHSQTFCVDAEIFVPVPRPEPGDAAST